MSSNSDIILNAGNRTHLDNTSSSASNITSLQVEGGEYIKKNMFIGGNLNITGNLNVEQIEAQLNTEEVVFNNPLLLIGQNNTGNDLLGGIINRYKDSNNDFKFTGLVKHNLESKPYVLINDVNTDSTNKEIDSTDLNTVVTNTSNNSKDNYCNIIFDKTKALSVNNTNTSNIGIYTEGSLGISKNVYIGDSNHTNSNIQFGDNTFINYNKNNNSKFQLNTNVNLEFKTTNSKSINIDSTNNLTYINTQNSSSAVGNNYLENIGQNFKQTIDNNTTETFENNFNQISNSLDILYNSPVSKYVHSTSRSDIDGNLVKTITGFNNFYIQNNIIETFHSDVKNNIDKSHKLNISNQKHNTVQQNLNHIYGSHNKEVDLTNDIIIHSSNNETYSEKNRTITNSSDNIFNLNYNQNISENVNLYTNNNDLTIKKKLTDISNTSNNTVHGNVDTFVKSNFDTNITNYVIETLKKHNNLTISSNLNQIVSGNNSISCDLELNENLDKNRNILIENNLDYNVNNKRSIIINQDNTETYKNNTGYNINQNFVIDNENNLNETYNNVLSVVGNHLPSNNIINLSTTRNTIIGSSGETNIDSLKIGYNLTRIYEKNSNENYKSDFKVVSNALDITNSIRYNMSCTDSTYTFNNDCTQQYDTNLTENIHNLEIGVRQIGGNATTVHDCVVRITESNKLYSSGSIHKKPNEYAPGDVLGTVTLQENNLIFFDYTVGQEEFTVTTNGGTINNVDYACLNGVYIVKQS